MDPLLFFWDDSKMNVSRLYTIPQCVPISKNPADDTDEKITYVQEKFLSLPEATKNKLADEETGFKIQAIGKNFGLELLQMSDIARAIRSYYFGEIKLEKFPEILSREMNVDLVAAQNISQLVIQRIINDDSQEKIYQAQIEKIPIEKALDKYPELGEQLITSSHIKLAVFPDPVRPSIKNWLSDYSFNVGISNRDPIVRGNYLFKSPNTMRLSSQDREKLSFILKSFEDKTPIVVNTKTKQIIFIAPEEKKSEMPRKNEIPLPINSNFRNNPGNSLTQKNASPTFQSDSDRLSAWRKNLPQKETLEKEPIDSVPANISFSSPQVFSTEKIERTGQTPRQNYSMQQQKQQNIYTSTRPMPKNVVNLREE